MLFAVLLFDLFDWVCDCIGIGVDIGMGISVVYVIRVSMCFRCRPCRFRLVIGWKRVSKINSFTENKEKERGEKRREGYRRGKKGIEEERRGERWGRVYTLQVSREGGTGKER